MQKELAAAHRETRMIAAAGLVILAVALAWVMTLSSELERRAAWMRSVEARLDTTERATSDVLPRAVEVLERTERMLDEREE